MSLLIRSFVLLVFTGCWGTTIASPIQTRDIVSVGGQEWAQPDQFLGLSWNDVNTVCPGGVCASQTLNGNDMSGWLWATVNDINQLFNHYIGYDALGPGSDGYMAVGLPASSAFYEDGWRMTGSVLGPYTLGWASDDSTVLPYVAQFLVGVHGFPINHEEAMGTDTQGIYLETTGTAGAWFYRNVSAVPLPATTWLFGSALIGLGVVKRRKL